MPIYRGDIDILLGLKDKSAQMNTYYIIDRNRVMHLQQAESIKQAEELFNDRHLIRHDVTIESKPCPHCSKVPWPKLPEWMQYTRAKEMITCSHTVNYNI